MHVLGRSRPSLNVFFTGWRFVEGDIGALCARQGSALTAMCVHPTCEVRWVGEKISKSEGMSKRIVGRVSGG